MDISELEETLKKLEAKRNLIKNHFSVSNLIEQFWMVQINIFTSIYFTAIAELAFIPQNTSELYQAYARSRQNSVRYLIELFLTSAYILKFPTEERFYEIYSMGLSEQINIHKIDLELDSILNTPQSNLKLQKNREQYAKFLTAYGKIHSGIPDILDDFLKPDPSPTKISNIGKRFSFNYLKHNKLEYTAEIKNNPFIGERLQKELLLSYSILSAEVHPTFASLEDFEIFIMRNNSQKTDHLLSRNQYFKAILNRLGKEMITLFDQVLT